MKKIYIYSKDGCERRSLDAWRLQKYLSINGHEIVHKPEGADLIILITCAALNINTEKALNKIKEFQKKYNAELIVGGCLPAIDGAKLDEIFNGRTIITRDLDRSFDKVDKLFPENKIKFKEIDDANTIDPHLLFLDADDNIMPNFFQKVFIKEEWLNKIHYKFRKLLIKILIDQHSAFYSDLSNNPFLLRISWGCQFNCAYCAIGNAIGSLHSKPLDDCLREFKKGLDSGHKIFIITADDTGSYGIDIGSNLPELLDKITSIPGNYKITIRDLNPQWIVKYIDDLEKIIKRNKITRVVIPIQSGSSRTLKLMRRYHDTNEMYKVFQRLKKSSPSLVFLTNFILGFPTETDEDFKETLSYIKKIDFDSGLIFPFSSKKGILAEKIEPKVPQDEIFRRLDYSMKFLKDIGYHAMYRRGSSCILYGKKVISL